MAIDAKAIVQQNKVLIALYVLAIVPIILWVVFVMMGVEGDTSPPPKGGKPVSYEGALRQLNAKKAELNSYVSKIKVMKDQIKNHQPLTAPIYTPRHTTEYQKRNEELKKQFEDMSTLVNGRQSKLDSWFADEKIQKQLLTQKEPTLSDFQSVFNNEIARLQKDYADLVFDNPSSATKACFLWQETVTPGAVRLFQRKFWIQEQILIALKKVAGDHGVDSLLDKIDFGTSAPGASNPGGNGPRFMTTIPVKVTYKGTFRDIPKVVRELLSQDISFRLTKLHTELQPFSITKTDKDGFEMPGLKINTESAKGLYDRAIYDAKLLSADKAPSDEESILPEPRLKITIELDALNFETDAIKAAANPAEAAQPQPAATADPGPPPKPKPRPTKSE